MSSDNDVQFQADRLLQGPTINSSGSGRSDSGRSSASKMPCSEEDDAMDHEGGEDNPHVGTGVKDIFGGAGPDPSGIDSGKCDVKVRHGSTVWL